MSYFTAVIAADGRGWRARDVDVDDVADLDELADHLRGAAVGDHPVIAVLEHEDEWFALVRVEGEEDPRLFVSDLTAASRSHYGEMLAVAADIGPDELDEPPTAEGSDEADGATSDDDDGTPVRRDDDPPAPPAWAGDAELLDDLGVPASRLRQLAEERGDDPAGVLGEVGEAVGFADLLEALR